MLVSYKDIIQLLIILFLRETGANLKTKTFLRKTDFNDYVCYPSNLQFFGYRESKLSCSEACGADLFCSSFFYNTLYKSCHGSQFVYLSTVACIEHVGTVYYAAENGATTPPPTTTQPVGIFGSPCSGHQDCLSPNTECWGNLCTCTPGYNFNADTLECTAGCTAYGSEYLQYNGYDMTCLITLHSSSAAEYCMGLCSENPSCFAVARDNFLNNCRLMSCTPRTNPGMWVGNNNCVSFIRNCATNL